MRIGADHGECGDTYDTIALKHGVSSASILGVTQHLQIIKCDGIPEGKELRLALKCETYRIREGDTCDSIHPERERRGGSAAV